MSEKTQFESLESSTNVANHSTNQESNTSSDMKQVSSPKDNTPCLKLFMKSGIALEKGTKHDYICKRCKQSFDSLFTLVQHLTTHSEKALKNKNAGKVPIRPLNKIQNQRNKTFGQPAKTNTGMPLFTCELCSKSFSYLTSLKRHVAGHTRPRPPPYKTYQKLLIISAQHSEARWYTCETCGKQFRFLHELEKHQLFQTTPFKCYVCNKTFSHISDFKQHMFLHSYTRPFKCDTCGRGFRKSEGLRKHSKVHAGVYIFKCETCGRGYGTSKGLKEHSKMHTENLLFKCETCGKSFEQPEGLKNHVKRHVKYRRFICETCGKTFIQKKTLIRHQEIHKKETVV